MVDPVIGQLHPLLTEDDMIIDGENSFYQDDLRRTAILQSRRFHYVDVGVSGGI